MAPKLAIRDVPQVTDYVAGLRKVGPNSYRVVTGVVVDGEAQLKVDTVEQPLEHAAETLRLALRKLLDETP